MFRPSGVSGRSGHKQIIESGGWRKLWAMANMASMASAAPEIMAEGSKPSKHCHARPSVVRELKAQSREH